MDAQIRLDEPERALAEALDLEASQYLNFFCNCDSRTNPVFLSAFEDAVERGTTSVLGLQLVRQGVRFHFEPSGSFLK